MALAAGAAFVAFGTWAFLAPRSFFDTVATFDPYNEHFLHDIGAFQIGLGAVLLLGALIDDALAAVLWGVGAGNVVHVVSHIIDRGEGGNPARDIPFFAVVSLVLLAAAAARTRPPPGGRA